MNDITPKPAACPFCGSSNVSSGEVMAESGAVVSGLCQQTMCLDCGACGPEVPASGNPPQNDEDADTAWNRRAACSSLPDGPVAEPELSAMCVNCGKSYGEHDYDDCLNGKTLFRRAALAAPSAQPPVGIPAAEYLAKVKADPLRAAALERARERAGLPSAQPSGAPEVQPERPQARAVTRDQFIAWADEQRLPTTIWESEAGPYFADQSTDTAWRALQHFCDTTKAQR